METATLYFSDLLPKWYTKDFERIAGVLKRHGIKYELLKRTKDIWARDYMPVKATNGDWIQFRYEPSFLKTKKQEKYHTQPLEVIKANNIIVNHYSGINLDGGNVVRFGDRVIITTRVFSENTWLPEEELEDRLKDLLQAEIIFIPDLPQRDDLTGHADGYVRFVNSQKVLVNEPSRYKKEKAWNDALFSTLEKNNLEIQTMPWFHDDSKKDSAIGIYVNYLEIGDVILFPVFKKETHKKTEENALEVIHSAFPNKKIEPVKIRNIGNGGGLLNCVSWC